MDNNFSETIIEANKFLKISGNISEIFTANILKNLSISPEEMGSLYERTLSNGNLNNKKGKEGIFYTPIELVDFIVKDALSKNTSDQFPVILDPAVGSGIFILRILNYLVEKYGTLTFEQLSNIHGWDKDNNALEITKLSIFAKLTEYKNLGIVTFLSQQLLDFFTSNFTCKDTLLDLKLNTEPSKNQCKDQFDLIIGNPPYGISRDEKISKEENEELKLIYKDYLSGKPEKYLLFMAKGFELLRAGGIMSFVVPNSWLAIKGAKKIRELLMRSGSLTDLTIVDYPAFKNAGVETVVFLTQKNADIKNVALKRINSKIETTYQSSFPIDYSINSKSFLIPTHWNKSAEIVLAKVFSQSVLLEDKQTPFEPLIALQAYLQGRGTPKQTKEDVKNHVFHYDYKFDADCYPYLEGADIKRFKIDWSGKYLRHGVWLAENQPIARYKFPRVLIREILRESPNCFVAGYTDDVFLYNKSVLHIIPKLWVIDAITLDITLMSFIKNRMKILSALLNSKLYSLIISLRGIKSQRKLFPKILNEDLKNLPVPKIIIDKDYIDKDYCGFADIDDYLNEDRCGEIAKRLFGLSCDEVKIIDEGLEGLPWKRERRATTLSNTHLLHDTD